MARIIFRDPDQSNSYTATINPINVSPLDNSERNIKDSISGAGAAIYSNFDGRERTLTWDGFTNSNATYNSLVRTLKSYIFKPKQLYLADIDVPDWGGYRDIRVTNVSTILIDRGRPFRYRIILNFMFITTTVTALPAAVSTPDEIGTLFDWARFTDPVGSWLGTTPSDGTDLATNNFLQEPDVTLTKYTYDPPSAGSPLASPTRGSTWQPVPTGGINRAEWHDNQLNGYPCVKIPANEVRERMQHEGSAGQRKVYEKLTTGDPYTVAILCNGTAASITGFLVMTADDTPASGANRGMLFTAREDSSPNFERLQLLWNDNSGNRDIIYSTASSWTPSTWTCLGYTCDHPTAEFFIDGVSSGGEQTLSTTSTISNAYTAAAPSFGNAADHTKTSRPFEGFFAEIIIYDEILTDSQWTDLMSYFNDRYNLSL